MYDDDGDGDGDDNDDDQDEDEESRIVGGRRADPHSHPWAAALKLNFGLHFCGGSVINRKAIICLYKSNCIF